MAKLSRRTRAGFTIIEVTVTLAILAAVGAIVVQALVWSVRERARLATHQAALELAANVLESARAQPWDQLNQAWADGQAIPSEMTALLPQGKLVVTVAPGKIPQTQRVTVEVYWHYEAHLPARSVRMTTVLSGRKAEKKGGVP